MTEGQPFPDYSAWLTADRYEVEAEHWSRGKLYLRYADELKALAESTGAISILELGCGDGWVPTRLDHMRYVYIGVDKNEHALAAAQERNTAALIYEKDIRDVTPEWLVEKHGHPDVDIVCSFAVLKHFGLHEWIDVVANMLKLGGAAAFSVPLAAEDKDDGTEFHHVWISEATLMMGVEKGGHRLIGVEPFGTELNFAERVGKEHILFTERMDKQS